VPPLERERLLRAQAGVAHHHQQGRVTRRPSARSLARMTSISDGGIG
jgi:hypothetical protein